MPQPQEFRSTKLGPGYFQIELPDWKQFVDYIYNDMLDFETYIWRGHRCDSWKLEPTIDRLVRDSKVSIEKRYDFQVKHLASFKLAARGRRGSNPPQIAEENDWWALGQHHGLATPLLDWTTSPFVAAFFAFSDIGEPQTDNRAIFALHQPSVEKWANHIRRAENADRRERLKQLNDTGNSHNMLARSLLSSKAESEIVIVRPQSDENQRLLNQGGLFTRSRTKKSIEDWVMEHHPVDDNGMSLIKVVVPDSERDKCLRTLNRMNINPLSLFPDLAGASKYCNLFAEIKNY